MKEETVGKTPVAVGSDPHIVHYINKVRFFIKKKDFFYLISSEFINLKYPSGRLSLRLFI